MWARGFTWSVRSTRQTSASSIQKGSYSSKKNRGQLMLKISLIISVVLNRLDPGAIKSMVPDPDRQK
jgi:hypothetical protein